MTRLTPRDITCHRNYFYQKCFTNDGKRLAFGGEFGPGTDWHYHLLADVTGETLHLGTLIESETIYVHKVHSRHMLGMYSKVGRRAPLHKKAIGKVLMAWEHPKRRELILQGMAFKRYREKTMTSRKPYLAELERTRALGFGEDREEFDGHTRCLRVPVFDRLNHPVAGLSIFSPPFALTRARAARSWPCSPRPAARSPPALAAQSSRWRGPRRRRPWPGHGTDQGS